MDSDSKGADVDEAELVARARLGDQEAFAELYQRHKGYVRGIGRKILRDENADDICQDTFLVAFTRLDSFEGNGRFRSWITRIAVNLCLISLRKRRQLVPLDQEAELLDRYVFSAPDAVLEGAPARMDLEKMMRILTPGRRRVLEMAYLEGVPDLEIAETLGISLTAVKTRLYQAKRRIRDVYTRH
jgi:RNA polymerase sigma-70 factor, ECF subfamily